MIIAVFPVGVVQATLDQIIGVLAVWYRLVAAAGPVDVLRAAVAVVAALGALIIDRDRVLIAVIAMRLMQVTAVDEVDVAVVDDCRMAAARPVNVVMLLVRLLLLSHR